MKTRDAYRAARRADGPDGWQMFDEVRELRRIVEEKDREIERLRDLAGLAIHRR